MNFRLDSGKLPRPNYNRVMAKSRRVICRPPTTPVVTQRQAKGIYDVAQTLNAVGDIQPAFPQRRRKLL